MLSFVDAECLCSEYRYTEYRGAPLYCAFPYSQFFLDKVANDSSLTQVFNFRLGRFANEQYFPGLYERTLPCISSFS